MDGHVGLSRYSGVLADRSVPVGGLKPPPLAPGVYGIANADTYVDKSPRMVMHSTS